MADAVLGGQINLQKMPVTTSNLMVYLSQILQTDSNNNEQFHDGGKKIDWSFVYFIQEPNVREGKVCHFSKMHNLYHDSSCNDDVQTAVYMCQRMLICGSFQSLRPEM